MIKRDTYINKIRPFIGNELIKVLTGIHRSGKSVMLELIKDELRRQGIPDSQFITFNFESMANAAYCTAKWQSEHKESSLLSFCIFLPFMIPSSVFAMGAQILFLRLPFKNAYLSVFLSHVLYSLPYATTYLTEGMRNNIKRLEEQGRVFGASGFYLLFKVTIPLLFPYLIPAFMMSFILSMSQYILTVLLGGGKLKTLSLIMVPFIQSGERNLASVYGLLFLLSSFLLFLLMEILLRGLKRREIAC